MCDWYYPLIHFSVPITGGFWPCWCGKSAGNRSNMLETYYCDCPILKRQMDSSMWPMDQGFSHLTLWFRMITIETYVFHCLQLEVSMCPCRIAHCHGQARLKSVSGAHLEGAPDETHGQVCASITIENGPVEIVDLPMNSMVDLSIVM